MDDLQYPVGGTVRAFGGQAQLAKALNLPRQNVHLWKKAKGGLIPRWWTAKIQAVAEQSGIRLPKPRKHK